MGLCNSRARYIEYHLKILRPYISTIRDCENQGVNIEVVRYTLIAEWEDHPTYGMRLTVAYLQEKYPHMKILSKKAWKTQQKRAAWC